MANHSNLEMDGAQSYRGIQRRNISAEFRPSTQGNACVRIIVRCTTFNDVSTEIRRFPTFLRFRRLLPYRLISNFDFRESLQTATRQYT